jgi:small subunit ribosomal protein S6
MTAKRTYNYEIMFLIGQAQAADLAAAIEHLKEIIVTRGHGEILAIKKWDERRLAYEIRGQKRGMYILCYAKLAGENLAHVERDCNLSEKILRTLIIRADHLTPDEIKAQDDLQGLMTEAKLRAERPKDVPVAPAPAEAPASEPTPA